MNKMTTCKIEGCAKPVVALEMCQMHYKRNKKYGSPHFVLRTQRAWSDESKIKIEGDYALVELTQGLWAKIDIADMELVSGFNWNWSSSNGYAYSAKAGTSMQQYIKGKAPNGMEIDHEDRDKLNNRRANLVFKTHSQNHFNSFRSDNAKTAHYHKASGKWRAIVTVNSLQVHLGLFDTPSEAAEVYLRAKYLARECATREEFKLKWKTMRLETPDTEKRDE